MTQPAARVTDMHTCPSWDGPKPHVGGPVLPPGNINVLIAFMPSASMGNPVICVGPPSSILMGSPLVLVGGRMAARMGDPTAHGGVIVSGAPTVLIGGAVSPPPPPAVSDFGNMVNSLPPELQAVFDEGGEEALKAAMEEQGMSMEDEIGKANQT